MSRNACAACAASTPSSAMLWMYVFFGTKFSRLCSPVKVSVPLAWVKVTSSKIRLVPCWCTCGVLRCCCERTGEEPKDAAAVGGFCGEAKSVNSEGRPHPGGWGSAERADEIYFRISKKQKVRKLRKRGR